MIYLRLFIEFFKAGLFAVGGGIATLPFIYDISDRLGWITVEETANMIAVSESTPGPFGVNMSTYTGYMTCGVGGAVVATLGLIAPSVIIIIIISAVLERFNKSFGVKAAFYGLRPASVALISSVCLALFLNALMNNGLYTVTGRLIDLFYWKSVALAGVLLLLTNIKHIKRLHPVIFIAFSAVAGIVFGFA